MAFEKFPNQVGQNWPVSTQYQTHPSAAVGVPASPQYATFPSVASTVDPATVAGRQAIYVYQTNITDAGAGKCSQWDDASGNARHATQVTAGERPDIITGPPKRLLYDGVNYELDGVNANLLVTAAAYTGFAVFEEVAISTNSASPWLNDAIFKDTGDIWGLHVRNNAGALTAIAFHWDGAAKSASVAFPAGGKKLITWWYDGTNINIQLNGGAAVTAAAGNVVGSLATQTCIGGKTTTLVVQFNGYIDDLALFNVSLPAADRDGITAFYRARHGI